MRNLLICLITLLPGLAAAQIPPKAAEVSRYTGLHAAAHRGDVADIERLISSKADLNAREPLSAHQGTARGRRRDPPHHPSRGQDVRIARAIERPLAHVQGAEITLNLGVLGQNR